MGDNFNNSSMTAFQDNLVTKSVDENQSPTSPVDTEKEKDKTHESSKASQQYSITVALSRLYHILSHFSTSMLSTMSSKQDLSANMDISAQTSNAPRVPSKSKTKDSADIQTIPEASIHKLSSKTSTLSKGNEKNSTKHFITKKNLSPSSLSIVSIEKAPTTNISSIINNESEASIDFLSPSSPLQPSLTNTVEQDESSEVISSNDTIDSNK